VESDTFSGAISATGQGGVLKWKLQWVRPTMLASPELPQPET
jgi:hypothetical protein